MSEKMGKKKYNRLLKEYGELALKREKLHAIAANLYDKMIKIKEEIFDDLEKEKG